MGSVGGYWQFTAINMAQKYCPKCFSKIRNEKGEGEQEWIDDPILTKNGLAGEDYKGFTYVKAEHIKQLQEYYKGLEERVLSSSERTYFSNVDKNHAIKHEHIEQLRISVEKILTAMGSSLGYYFGFDKYGKSTGLYQSEWTDCKRVNGLPLLPSNTRIKAIHIEELRIGMLLAVRYDFPDVITNDVTLKWGREAINSVSGSFTRDGAVSSEWMELVPSWEPETRLLTIKNSNPLNFVFERGEVYMIRTFFFDINYTMGDVTRWAGSFRYCSLCVAWSDLGKWSEGLEGLGYYDMWGNIQYPLYPYPDWYAYWYKLLKKIKAKMRRTWMHYTREWDETKQEWIEHFEKEISYHTVTVTSAGTWEDNLRHRYDEEKDEEGWVNGADADWRLGPFAVRGHGYREYKDGGRDITECVYDIFEWEVTVSTYKKEDDKIVFYKDFTYIAKVVSELPRHYIIP